MCAAWNIKTFAPCHVSIFDGREFREEENQETMEGRLSSGAKPFISKFTRHAQVSIPEKKLTKALVKKQDYQDEIERQRDSSDQRWRVLFESDERQVHL